MHSYDCVCVKNGVDSGMYKYLTTVGGGGGGVNLKERIIQVQSFSIQNLYP